MTSLVSIIVPVYNGENHIRECLISCVDSSNTNIEVIVVNDGSTDSTESLINDLKNEFHNVFSINQSNQGVSVARNNGLKRASGEYIIFVDSDDSLELSLLPQLISRISSLNLDAIVPYNYSICDGKYKRHYERLQGQCLKYPNFYRFDDSDTLSDLRSSICGIVFRRDFLLNIDLEFRSISIGEDSLFFLEFYLSGARISFFDVDFYKVNIRRDSASRSISVDRLEGLIKGLGYYSNLYSIFRSPGAKKLISLKYYRITSTIANVLAGMSKSDRKTLILELSKCVKIEYTFSLNSLKYYLANRHLGFMVNLLSWR